MSRLESTNTQFRSSRVYGHQVNKKIQALEKVLKAKRAWEVEDNLYDQNQEAEKRKFEVKLQEMKRKKLKPKYKPKRKKKKGGVRRPPPRPKVPAMKHALPYPAFPVKRQRIVLDVSSPHYVNPTYVTSVKEETYPNMKACLYLINMLFYHPEASPFQMPVDHIALRIPTYPQIIKDPMDLGTVRTQVLNGTILSADQFAMKVRLVFRNAKLFNRSPLHFIHRKAVFLENLFEDQFRQLELIQKRLNSYLAASIPSQAVLAKPSQVVSAPPPIPHAPGTGSAQMNPPPPKKEKGFTKLKKLELRNMVVQLSEDKMEGILDVIGFEDDGEETFDLDLEKLPDEKLQALWEYCKK